MRCFLHIGGEKTGSTSLQEFLHAQRQAFADAGILVSVAAGIRNNRRLTLAGYPADRRDDFTAFMGIESAADLASAQADLRRELAAELHAARRRGCHTVVFSSEHLQSRLRSAAEVALVRDLLVDLGLQDFQVVYYLRDPVLVAQSLFSTGIKSGATTRAQPGPDNRYYGHVCDHQGTLKRYGEVFGMQALLPRLFVRDQLRRGCIVRDFLALMDFDPDMQLPVPKALNESLSWAGMQLLAGVNARFPKELDRDHQMARAELIGAFERHFGQPKYRMDPAVAEAYRAAFAEGDEWVRRKFFPERSSLFEAGNPVDGLPVASSVEPLDADAVAGLVYDLWREPFERVLRRRPLWRRALSKLAKLLKGA